MTSLGTFVGCCCRYVRSPFDGQGPGFKVSLYSKLPFEDLVLYHLRGRPCVTGFVTIEGRKVAVSSVHLTSGRNAGIRQKQLALLYGKTRDCETSLVFGDMNACQPGDDVSVNQEGFVDVWPALHPNEPGVTRLHSRSEWNFWQATILLALFVPCNLSLCQGKGVKRARFWIHNLPVSRPAL